MTFILPMPEPTNGPIHRAVLFHERNVKKAPAVSHGGHFSRMNEPGA